MLMLALVLVPVVVAVALLVPGRRVGLWGFRLGACTLAAALVALIAVSPSVLDGDVRSETIEWVPALGLDFAFRLDGFGWFMAVVVSAIGALVFAYSAVYFRDHHGHASRPDVGRIAGLLLAFAAAMLGLVLADGFFTLFCFWELTSVTSFLLIGIDDRSAKARSAAQRALLVTALGGLALLAGLVLLGLQSGVTTISALVADPPGGTVTTVALVLVLTGAFAKSAQFPLHFWLPGAMAAPTPVSAYLHSATMVKAGIVLIARFAPAFATVGPWRPLVIAAGGLSLLLGGWRALREQDAKLALAHGTVSQLGLLVLLFGIGDPKLTFAGTAMLLAHALFKAALFLVVGIVDHSANTRDLRRLTGLGRVLPGLAVIAGAAALSMAAVIPTFGFVAKEAGLQGLLDLEIGGWGVVALAAFVVGAVITVAYTARLFDQMFGRGAPQPRVSMTRMPTPIVPGLVHRPGPAFLAPPALLAALSVAFGLAAGLVGEVIAEVAASLDPESATKHLVLWPGLKPALFVTVASWIVGLAVTEGLRRRARGTEPRPVLATRVYAWCYDGVLEASRRVTAVSQSGSLPVYVGVILCTVVAAVVYAATAGFPTLDSLPLADSPVQAVLAVACGALGVGVLTARRRFTGALLLGGSGYALALVFLAHGAPDLAVTQFLVETLVIVMFLLVLQHLPDGFRPPPSWAPRALRFGLAAVVGISVTVFALAVSSSRTEPSVGRDYVARSVPEGGGRNVVNVILVDFRGFDTLGEITVLAVAAIGIVNLVGHARREQRRKRLADGTDDRGPVGPTVVDPDIGSRFRSAILSTTVRGIAPALGAVAVFVAARGHNAPGGGFAGGLILATAIALGYLADGRSAFRLRPIQPLVAVGAGLLLSVGVAVTPLFFGGALLESAIVTVDVPAIGPVKMVSSALFDVGVMILVTGAVLAAMAAFVGATGTDPTEDAADDPAEVLR